MDIFLVIEVQEGFDVLDGFIINILTNQFIGSCMFDQQVLACKI